MNNKSIFKYIEEFLNKHLFQEKEASSKTIENYKVMFSIMFKYIQSDCNFKINTFDFNKFTLEFITNFLNYLKDVKNNSEPSLNLRLAMIKSFSSYVLTNDPQYSELKKILNIKRKKYLNKSIDVLSEDEIKRYFATFNIYDKKECRELLMVVILYDCALRINELLDLKIEDIKILGNDNYIIIRNGKGNKYREVPLSNNAINIIHRYYEFYNFKNKNNNYLFTNPRNERISSNAIRKILRKHQLKLLNGDGLMQINIHPHIFRHSKATHLVDKGVPLIQIQQFLGHTNLTTTQIYITTNIRQKRETLETIEDKIKINTDNIQISNDNQTIEFLRGLGIKI